MRQLLLAIFALTSFGGIPLPSAGQISANAIAPGQIEIQRVRFDRSKLVDEFGQWIQADWPGKAKSFYTGRNDGENYNIGVVDVTDRPYTELVEAAKLTHARLLDVHSGKLPPVTRKAKSN